MRALLRSARDRKGLCETPLREGHCTLGVVSLLTGVSPPRHICGDVHLHSKVRRLSQWAQCTHFQRVRALLHVHTRSGCGVRGAVLSCSPQTAHRRKK